MADSRYRLFFVYLHNARDNRDDRVVKVRARTKGGAKRLVADGEGLGLSHFGIPDRYGIGQVFTLKGLKRYHADWHALLWGTEPEYEES